MREIKGYEGLYAVDESGIVHSLQHNNSRRKGPVKPFVNTGGYLRVNLFSADGVQRKHYVHRLVSEAYIPNPLGLPAVNHINANKDDNTVENLEWCDAKHNIAESRRLGLQKKDRRVKATNLSTGEERYFNTIKSAAETLTGKWWAFAYSRRKKLDSFNCGDWYIEVENGV